MKNLILVLFALFFSSLQAQEKDWQIGFIGGYSSPSESSLDSRFGLGGQVSYFFWDFLETGIYIHHSGEDTMVGKYNDTAVMVEGNYYFRHSESEFWQNFHLGLKLGSSNRSLKLVHSQDPFETGALTVGFEVGQDFHIYKALYAGLEINYISFASAEKNITTDTTTTTYRFNSLEYLNAVATLFFRF